MKLSAYRFVHSNGFTTKKNLPSDESAFAMQSELNQFCEGTEMVCIHKMIGSDWFGYVPAQKQGENGKWIYIP